MPRLTLNSFKSFRGEHEISLLESPGLYFLSGENHATPNLASNGSGKTTVWDGISWCLFGKTTAGLRGPSIICRGEKSCWVVLNFGPHSVRRSQNPNSLTYNDLPVTQEELESKVRLSWNSFTSGVVIGQGSRGFLELTPQEKLGRLTEVLRLGVWERAHEVCLGLWKDLQGKVDSQLRDLSSLKENWKILKETLDRAQLEGSLFEGKKADRIQSMEGSLRKREIDLAAKRVEMGKLSDSGVSGIQPSEHRVSLDLSLRGLVEEKVSLQKELAQISLGIRNREEEKCAISQNLSVCPYCGSPNVRDRNLKRLEELKGELKELGSQEEKKNLSLRELEDSIDNLSVELREIVRVDSERIQENAIRANTRRSLQTQIDNLEREIQYNLSVLTKEREEKNPWNSLMEETEEKIYYGVLRKQFLLSREIRSTKKGLSYLEFWKSGFREIRLWVVDQALQNLEIECNDALESLGLVGWELRLRVERENSTGGITKGFTVLVLPPGEVNSTPLESWSGGEMRRLRLACDLGFSNLIRNSLGVDFPLEVWDEPTSALSPQGVEDFLRFLQNRARLLGRSIWVVDHTFPEFPFDGNMRILKDSGGSHVECSPD